jgi:hypothetical protein
MTRIRNRYKLRKYPTSAEHKNFGYAIGVPAALAREYPDGQTFQCYTDKRGRIIFDPK